MHDHWNRRHGLILGKENIEDRLEEAIEMPEMQKIRPRMTDWAQCHMDNKA